MRARFPLGIRPHVARSLAAVLALLLAACSESTTSEPNAGGSGPPRIERGAPLTQVPDPEEPGPLEPGGDELGGETPGKRAGAVDDVAAGLASGGVDLESIGAIDGAKKGSRELPEGVTPISWMDLSMQDLPMEDLLDALLYPEEYGEGEFEFPERIRRHDGERIAIVGYMIPLVWEETAVPEFMLVRDLLGCCFGGSPQPDEWISVVMEDEGAEYYPYIPVVVIGTLKIEGIEDEAGYAAGCFHVSGESVEKER